MDATPVPEKRKKLDLSKEEVAIIRWQFTKALFPIALIIVISCIVLYFGLQFLITNISFGNYGVTPTATLQNASRFISAYAFIAITNVILMIALSVLVMYMILHDIVMPVLRVTREYRQSLETNTKKAITVRKTDRLLLPLVELLNKTMQ